MKIIPIILCGGSGSRLFPLSRKNIPKQFLDLENNGRSMFQNTIFRIINSPINPERIAIISNKQHEHIINHQLQIFDIKVDLILEPVSRNTAPAILFSLMLYYQKLELLDHNLMFLPADHVYNQSCFNDLIKKLDQYGDATSLIFGVQPTCPETGYGYIHFDGDQVVSFHEKPSALIAQEYFQDPSYNWNSGMFVFNKHIISHFDPEMILILKRVVQKSTFIDNKIYIDDDFQSCQDISIDYALMEKIPHITKFISYQGYWSDIGSYTSLLKYTKQFINVDSQNNYVNTQKKTILNGVENLVVAESHDIILISDINKSQEIKNLCNQIPNHLLYNQSIDYRPWGFYEVILDGESCKIKKITVYPNKRLSLQSHRFRSEHWICLAGSGKAQINDDYIPLTPNSHVYVPCETKHRMINDDKTENLIIIEMQTGEYFGEDDIVRYEDDYGRL